jgi:hypothetical protein
LYYRYAAALGAMNPRDAAHIVAAICDMVRGPAVAGAVLCGMLPSARAPDRPTPAAAAAILGGALYKSNPAETGSLKAPGFNP